MSTVFTQMGNVVATEIQNNKDILDNNLSIESTARTNADIILQGNIDTETNRVDAILSASDADKDSFVEIVTLINSVDTTNDASFANYVLTNDGRVLALENQTLQLA